MEVGLLLPFVTTARTTFSTSSWRRRLCRYAAARGGVTTGRMSDEDLLKNISVRTTVRMGMLLHNVLPPPHTSPGGCGGGVQVLDS